MDQLKALSESRLFELNSDTATDAQFSPKQGQSISEATKPAQPTPTKPAAVPSKKALEDLA